MLLKCLSFTCLLFFVFSFKIYAVDFTPAQTQELIRQLRKQSASAEKIKLRTKRQAQSISSYSLYHQLPTERPRTFHDKRKGLIKHRAAMKHERKQAALIEAQKNQLSQDYSRNDLISPGRNRRLFSSNQGLTGSELESLLNQHKLKLGRVR